MPVKTGSDLSERVRKGDIAAAARAMSVVVDERPEADELSKAFFPYSGRTQKIGLCGPPGAGKSSLAGRLIGFFRKQGLKVGMLAVDPSSPISGGAFLGDRLRIQEHATDSGVFIRSLASRGMIGGVSHTIFGAIHVLEAAGFDKIIVETVGTGQDEVEIGRVADSVVYVTTPQLGDEIQAMKAGVMEIGDFFVVNKADIPGADKAISDLKGALALGRGHAPKPWEPPVLGASAASGEGVAELGRALERHWNFLRQSGEGKRRLREQHREELSLYISRRAYRDAMRRVSDKNLDDLLEHRIDPASLGARILRA